MRRKKTTGVWLIIMAVFITELFFFAWCRVQCVRKGYEISKNNNKYQNLIALQKSMKIELARLKSPERLTEIAKNRFGLVTPTSKQTIIIP